MLRVSKIFLCILAVLDLRLSRLCVISGIPEPDKATKQQLLWQPFNKSAIAIQVATGPHRFCRYDQRIGA